MNHPSFLKRTLLLLGLLLGAGQVLAETPPQEIRIGGPSLSTSGSNHWGWGLLGIAHSQGLFQEEFKNDAVSFKFVGLNTVPMVGEALASNQIDFAGQGDLISLIGRSAGLQTRYVLPVSKYANAYLAVAKDSPISSVAELKGKRVAYTRGTYVHLQVIRILAANGLTERDLRQVNLDMATANTALATGDVDAVFSGPDLLPLRDSGVARIVYTTRDGDLHATAQTGLIVREDFASRYPETTARVVKVLVRAARWASDEANREGIYGPWWSFRLQSAVAEDSAGRSWKQIASPLFDPFLIAQYKDTNRLAKELRLLRGKDFDVEQWMDRSFLDKALQDLDLQGYWPALDAEGRVIDGQGS
ncbi:ABC transporter substrate-binding protein [Pseudomonas sp. ABC1]|uniref:ABC transporter substrate-binding protein n=1 Tax=Pseudomonas sp. ABC1 TaxID=2748080 RepID=UPI0015C2ED84|nr:ABC transporter substrate-binding protein [Pseudomonas sp. ABC1]QLF93979.1 ABC transporter substrate-binding protein [Pseudomonas sp. ABC1]